VVRSSCQGIVPTDNLNAILRTSAAMGAKVEIGITGGEIPTQWSLCLGIKYNMKRCYEHFKHEKIKLN
jgi:hypothetical protein